MEQLLEILHLECATCGLLFLPESWQSQVPWNLRRCNYCAAARTLVTEARTRSGKNERICLLDEKYIASVIRSGTCQATGLPFDMSSILLRRYSSDGRKRRRGLHVARVMDPFAPSLDRIDSAGDYIMSNIRVVLWMFNISCSTWGHGPVIEMSIAFVKKMLREGKLTLEQLKEEVDARLIQSV